MNNSILIQQKISVAPQELNPLSSESIYKHSGEMIRLNNDNWDKMKLILFNIRSNLCKIKE